MLSVNATEVEALISNNILKINLDNTSAAKKIMGYLKVKGTKYLLE
jgi:hypothetical protein